jgi:hypothetical protein
MPSGMRFDHQLILYLQGKNGSNEIDMEGFIWIEDLEFFEDIGTRVLGSKAPTCIIVSCRIFPKCI